MSLSNRLMPGSPTIFSKSGWRFSSTTLNPAFSQAEITLAEETSSNAVVQRQLRSGKLMVGNAGRIFRDQRHGPGSTRVGSLAAVIEERRQPVFPCMHRAIVAVVLERISVTGAIPVLVGEQRIAEDARVAQRDPKSLSPGWITCGG